MRAKDGASRTDIAQKNSTLFKRHVFMHYMCVGLDPEQRIRFRELLVGLARGRIILLWTHIVSDVESTADRIVVVSGGRVVDDGARDEVIGVHPSLESAYLTAVGRRR